MSTAQGWRKKMADEELISIIAHGIADAQGDAYAEYSSEFDGYARAALAALRKNLAGLSTNGINVWGTPADIKAVMRALYSDSILEDVRTQARHWREECGKVHAHKLELLGALKAMLQHSCVADAAPEDKFPEDHAAERLARTAIAKAEGVQ